LLAESGVRWSLQRGYSQLRHCELDELLRQWTPQGNEILYVLALRMRRRREVSFRVGRQDRVGHVTMVNLNGSGTIRLVYLQLVNQWDQLHPLTASETMYSESVALNRNEAAR
jgi:hypothetical protein